MIVPTSHGTPADNSEIALIMERSDRRMVRRRAVVERVAFAGITLITILTVTPVLLIVGYLLFKGFRGLSISFLTHQPSNHLTAGGIFPMALGTINLVVLTMIIALPLGILSAIYLNEYARQNWWTRSIRMAIINLAGVPSIVFGMFGLALFVIGVSMPFHTRLFGFGKCLLAGSLTLSLLVLPLIITTTEAALRAVPRTFREASLGIGSTRWQALRRVVLPSALPGILTGLVLSVGRAAGETAPILFTAAVFNQTRTPGIFELGQPVMALPYHLYVISMFVPDAPDQIKWNTAVVLLVTVLAFNVVALVIRARYRRNRKW